MASSPQSVVVAVDFGSASAHAIRVGGVIVDRCGHATLKLVHAEAIDAPPYFTAQQLDGLERQRQELRGQAELFLMRFGRQHTPVPFSSVVDDRPAVDAILHHAASADLLVMGTHGRHGPKRWWLGSVAERVLRQVPRPLLIVRGETAQPAESIFDRMVVHCSSLALGEQALDYARGIASCFNGQVIDRRADAIPDAIETTRATLLVAPVPRTRTGAWLSDYGEPLVRFCTVPILFVPEVIQGAPS